MRAYVDAFRTLASQAPSIDSNTLISRFRCGLSPSLSTLIAPRLWTTLDDDIEFIVRVGSAQAAAAGSSASAAASSGATESSSSDGDASSSSSSMDVSALAALLLNTAGRSSGSRTELLLTALVTALSRGGVRDAQGSNGASGSAGLPQIKGLTPAEVRAYMDHGLCFGCASIDHLSHACPRRRVGADGRVSFAAAQD